MGDIVDAILEGVFCQNCGEYLGEGDGFPVTCPKCLREEREEEEKGMKIYVTFGQTHTHTHRVNGKIFDCDCVAIIKAPTAEEGRAIAMELFAGKFATIYTEETWNSASIQYYPRGYLEANP